jgi:hypothetical protein
MDLQLYMQTEHKLGIKTYAEGTQIWFQSGRQHRVGGPAVIHADGSQEWFQNGRLHRLDGPAIIEADGRQGWWLYGVEYTEDKYPFNLFRKEHHLPETYEDWPIDMRILFELIWR